MNFESNSTDECTVTAKTYLNQEIHHYYKITPKIRKCKCLIDCKCKYPLFINDAFIYIDNKYKYGLLRSPTCDGNICNVIFDKGRPYTELPYDIAQLEQWINDNLFQYMLDGILECTKTMRTCQVRLRIAVNMIDKLKRKYPQDALSLEQWILHIQHLFWARRRVLTDWFFIHYMQLPF